jgi:DNA-binding response OmpR family regulator
MVLSADISICTQTLTGSSYQQTIKYTRRDVDVLAYLQRQHKSVYRDELLKEVWGNKNTSDIYTRTVDKHIAKNP